jgi:hypothetical protein
LKRDILSGKQGEYYFATKVSDVKPAGEKSLDARKKS